MIIKKRLTLHIFQENINEIYNFYLIDIKKNN